MNKEQIYVEFRMNKDKYDCVDQIRQETKPIMWIWMPIMEI